MRCCRAFTRSGLSFILIGVISSSTSYAAEKAKRTTTSKPKAAVDDDNDRSTGADTSEQARRSQTANADMLYTPASDFVLTYGAGASYNVKPHLAAGFSLLMGTKSISESKTENGTTVSSSANLNGMAAYGYGRYFFGNSFNVTGGLGLRTATIDYSVEQVPIKITGKINIQSIVIPIFIGNRWTWKPGFTIGCDWAGIMIPISGSSKATIDGNLTSETMKELNQIMVDLGDELAHKSSLTLLLTSVGWAF